MVNNIKIRQIQAFLCACTAGSFAAAAQRMHVTPPAFSQMIRELETTLGTLLFERTTRNVALTAAGRLLQSRVERPIEELDDVYLYFKDISAGERGTVSFSALPSVAFDIGANTMGVMRTRYPGIRIRQIEDQQDNIVQRVLDRETDFGFGMAPPAHADLHFEPLLKDELVAVLPRDHPYAAQRRLRWQQLVDSPLILLPPSSGARQLVEARLTLLNQTREPIHEVINMVTALSMVRAGFGLTVQPRLALHSLKMQGLVFRRIAHPPPERTLGLITRRDRPLSPAAATVAAGLRREVIRQEGQASAPAGPAEA